MSDQPTRIHEVARRRTFAIISHPDAGKTTLTEKLLLYGGVLELAGAVKAKRSHANAVSDWMQMEQERGISITTSVLRFPYRGLQMNLLDTPGHADFSEDTYRTLHAVDGAIMLLDRAKGVESQTRKLFRVCRQRALPIFTFVNKMDRPGRHPFSLVGEVEDVLSVRVFPVTWPVFRNEVFRGVYHRLNRRVYWFDERRAGSSASLGASRASFEVTGLDDPRLAAELGKADAEALREEIELLDAAGDQFDMEAIEKGDLSPLFVGSAINNLGLEPFLDTFCELMPAPGPRAADPGPIAPFHEEFTGFVFKIQANMDPRHRDRVAFVRVCSGRFERDMKIRHVRTGRTLRLANPSEFFAQDRNRIDEAFAGDVIGVYDPGLFQIGDALTEGTPLSFEEIPRFPPERFARLVLLEPMKRKRLTRGLEQLAQEGGVQLYQPPSSRASDVVLGAVGELQLEVAKHRLQHEYRVNVDIERLPYRIAAWVSRKDGARPDLEEIRTLLRGLVLLDAAGLPVVLFEDEWAAQRAEKRASDHDLAETPPVGSTVGP